MKTIFCLFIIIPVVLTIQETDILEIIDSGHDDVAKFSTAITFYINIINNGNSLYDISVTPEECCLIVDQNDTDCNIIELGNPKNIFLDNTIGNNTVVINFVFRNLYARYRTGNCSFIMTGNGDIPIKLKHSISFNTYPNGQVISKCSGIDQDPDRNCTPVDCAIKYKGQRNYYNNSIHKCESVVECNTRGSDGVTIIAYYDWEDNICVQYKWFSDDNYLKQVESDTEIPVEIDPSQSIYYPDLEPHLLTNISELSCNHGKQNEYYCECDDGWISSGIHKDNPIEFHWCDQEEETSLTYSQAPRTIGKIQEYVSIILLTIVNILLLVSWIYLLVKLVCPGCMNKVCCKK